MLMHDDFMVKSSACFEELRLLRPLLVPGSLQAGKACQWRRVGLGESFSPTAECNGVSAQERFRGHRSVKVPKVLNVPKVPRYWIVLEPGSGFARFRRFLGVLEGWGVRGGVMITFLKVTHMLEASSTTEVIA